MEMGRPGDAVKELREAIRLDPRSAAARESLDSMLRMMGRSPQPSPEGRPLA